MRVRRTEELFRSFFFCACWVGLIVLGVAFRASACGTGEEVEALQTVAGFGRKLQEVNLLAPREVCEGLLRQHYTSYVASGLLKQWFQNPQQALGRYGSSPWPDRIEIRGYIKEDKGRYVVFGEVVEVTSVPGEERRGEVLLLVERVGDRWWITEAQKQVLGLTLPGVYGAKGGDGHGFQG
ncbi:hypothetical protein ACP6EK_06890 [Candidatus Caldatribacterium sp. SIUC1]|uniref:hypothetical protein n=1 Tax=Candidatus Caldatribacterium sp. SIUC1 TaxID=3418365 RepID=UPI003F68FD1A